MRCILFTLVSAMAFVHAGCGADNISADNAPPNSATITSTLKSQSMKIRLKVEVNVVTATLQDNATARDFVSLLPLELTLVGVVSHSMFACWIIARGEQRAEVVHPEKLRSTTLPRMLYCVGGFATKFAASSVQPLPV